MAEVSIKIKGDSKDLVKELDKVEGALDDVGTTARTTGDRLGGVGDKADSSEQRIMGLRDMVDGTAAIMAGPGEAGISAYLQGWADMASGVVNFAVPALQALASGMLTQIKTTIAAGAATVAQAARQVAAWVMLGVQSTIQAAKVAAAWLISMGPIAIVIAAVVGLVALIVTNFDKIKEVIAAVWDWLKGAASAVWDWVKGAVAGAVDFIRNIFLNFTPLGLIIKNFDKIKELATGVKDWIVEKFGQVLSFFTELPGRIGSAAAGMWDGIKNAFRAAINWIIDRWNNFTISFGGQTISLGPLGSVTIPRVTINTPDIPRLHSGGVFRAPRAGGEGLAMLKDGETVTPAGMGSGGVTIVVQGFVGSERQLAAEIDRILTRRARTNRLGFSTP